MERALVGQIRKVLALEPAVGPSRGAPDLNPLDETNRIEPIGRPYAIPIVISILKPIVIYKITFQSCKI